MYNTWDLRIWVVITIFGWSALLKGVLYFLAPGAFIKESIRVFAHPNIVRFFGLLMIVFGGWLSYAVYYV